MFSLMALFSFTAMAQEEWVYKTLGFPDANSENNKCLHYDEVWTATANNPIYYKGTRDGSELDSWTVTHFSNNIWQNAARYDSLSINCGRKCGDGMASIATDSAYSAAVTKVVLVKTRIYVEYATITLVVARDKEFTDVVETVNADFGEASYIYRGDLEFRVTKPAKNLYYKVNIDYKDNVSPSVSLYGVNYYIQGQKTAISLKHEGPQTDYDAYGRLIVRKGEVFKGIKATVTPEGAKGTLVYSLCAPNYKIVADLDSVTGEVKFTGNLGDIRMKARFIPEDGYDFSESEFPVSYRESPDPKTIHFAGNEGAFPYMRPSSQNETVTFKDLNGDNYDFTVPANGAFHGVISPFLDLYSTISSPAFTKFPYGYRVSVLSSTAFYSYCPLLTCDNYPGLETKYPSFDDLGGVYELKNDNYRTFKSVLDIPYADGKFTISAEDTLISGNSGRGYHYIFAITLTPFTKPMSVPGFYFDNRIVPIAKSKGNGITLKDIGFHNPNNLPVQLHFEGYYSFDEDVFEEFKGTDHEEQMPFDVKGWVEVNVLYKGDDNYVSGSTRCKVYLVEDTDGIEELPMENPAKADTGDSKIYNLQGQIVKSNDLKKGIYVKNGKKFIVR